MAASSGTSTPQDQSTLVWLALLFVGFYAFASKAYELRLFAINEFGPIIHEFDPYFNWRATLVRSLVSFFVRKCAQNPPTKAEKKRKFY